MANELFALQERVIRRVVSALAGPINVADRHELSRPRIANLDAYDQFLYGLYRFFRFPGASENEAARESFRRAIALEPEFALARSMLAWTHVFDAMNGWQPSREDSLHSGLIFAKQAVDLDPAMPVAYFVRDVAYRELDDWPNAPAEAEKAIAYDPNDTGAHVLLPTLMFYSGRLKEGLALMQRAIALNPHHPYNYGFHLGQAFYLLGKYPEAIEAFNRVIEPRILS